MEAKHFIICKNLDFGYDSSKNVLSGIDFSLPKGQTLAIVGASGCGKSTLLRILSGILPSTKSSQIKGEVKVNGLSPDEYRKSGKLAFMFQEATLMPNLTVRENVALPLKIKGKPDYEKVDALINMVGLTDYAQYLPNQLSGGMKTRMALARSFATEPELLLLDEPFSALDIAWKSKLYIELEKLKEKFNTTLILVTHDVQEAILLSTNIITLKLQGTINTNEKLETKISVMQRLDESHKFLDYPEFSNMLKSVQAAIMIDGWRHLAQKSDAERIVKEIETRAGSAQEAWVAQEKDNISIRKFSNTKEIHEALFRAFLKGSTFFFKYQLMWDVLNYENTETERQEVMLRFYLDNITRASDQALVFYQRTHENISEYLVQSRIGDPKHPKAKRWIYLCDMYASTETDRVLNYYQDVIDGKIEPLNYDFAKKVAHQMKNRVENERAEIRN